MTRNFLIASMALCLGGSVAFADKAAPDPKILRLWKGKCGSCHGDDGKGQTTQGKKLNVKDLTAKKPDAKTITDSLANGVKDKDGKEVMKKAEGLKPDQIDGLIKFIGDL